MPSTPVHGTSQLNFARSGTTLAGAGSYTPPANTLITVVAAVHVDAATNSLSIADTWGGLTWTQTSVQMSFTDPGSGGSSILTVAVFTAVTGASPSSGTYTITSSQTINLARADVYTVGSTLTSGPVGTTGTSTGSNTGSTTVNETLTLGTSPAASSMVLAVLGALNSVAGDSPSTPTDDANYTQLEQVTIGSVSSNDFLAMDVSYRNGSASNSLTWGLPGSQNVVGSAGVAVEIVAPPVSTRRKPTVLSQAVQGAATW